MGNVIDLEARASSDQRYRLAETRGKAADRREKS
jgi:hypothetical protein